MSPGRELALRTLLLLMENHDRATRIHMENVACNSGLVAQASGCDRAGVEQVYLAALLHDVGKVVISPALLRKPGHLSPDEMEAMRRHAGAGGRIVAGAPTLAGLAPLVRSHHEWLDGRGYPDGLVGEQIPPGARIIAVADAFDTMTTVRPYRRPVSLPAALAELRRCCGTQFDPAVVDAFSRVATQPWFRTPSWLDSELGRAPLTGTESFGLPMDKA